MVLPCPVVLRHPENVLGRLPYSAIHQYTFILVGINKQQHHAILDHLVKIRMTMSHSVGCRACNMQWWIGGGGGGGGGGVIGGHDTHPSSNPAPVTYNATRLNMHLRME